jgi:integrase
MATISKLDKKSGTRYKAIIRKDGRIVKTKTFTRKRDAKLWAQRIESDQETLTALGSPGAAIKVENLATEYLDQWTGRDSGHPNKIAWWVKRIGHKRLIDVTRELAHTELKKFASEPARRYDGHKLTGYRTKSLGRQRAPATINRMKAAGSSLFRYAVGQNYIPTNPFRGIPALSENNKRQRFLSEDERQRLLEVCKSSEWDRLYLLVLMALTTGCRQGELLGLTWDRIDFKEATAYLPRTKNGEPRTVPLPNMTLAELQKVREIGSGLLFPSELKPNSAFEFRKHWDRALVDAGIEDFRFHDLRHSAASMLVNMGIPLYTVGQILGHKNQQTTARYAHLSIETKRQAVDKLSSLEW